MKTNIRTIIDDLSDTQGTLVGLQLRKTMKRGGNPMDDNTPCVTDRPRTNRS